MSPPKQSQKQEQGSFLVRLLDENSTITRSEVLEEVQKLKERERFAWEMVEQERKLAAEFAKQSRANQIGLLKMIEHYKETNRWLWKLKRTPES